MKIDLKENTINNPHLVVNREWKVRADHRAQVAYNSLKATAREDWYFDVGCFRHITCDKSYLSNVKICAKSYITLVMVPKLL